MKNKISILLLFLFSTLSVIAQNPREIHQQDQDHKSIWTSTESLLIAIALIVGIFLAQRWSKKAHKKRDEAIKDDKK